LGLIRKSTNAIGSIWVHCELYASREKRCSGWVIFWNLLARRAEIISGFCLISRFEEIDFPNGSEPWTDTRPEKQSCQHNHQEDCRDSEFWSILVTTMGSTDCSRMLGCMFCHWSHQFYNCYWRSIAHLLPRLQRTSSNLPTRPYRIQRRRSPKGSSHFTRSLIQHALQIRQGSAGLRIHWRCAPQQKP
jgi:hypothetical protein